ncbi:MAG: DNA recombination protein RmuC, partial [Planctomycetia bacterium]
MSPHCDFTEQAQADDKKPDLVVHLPGDRVIIVDAKVPDSKDEKTGLPVYSLYGERRKPTDAQLEGIDTLVYDIQDAGCRFYTYSSTLGNIMEAASDAGV